MTKTKSTKRALLMSALSLLLCVSMLIGTTYAWFTDTAVSAGNKIVAGNLDVVLEYKTDWDNDWAPVDENTKIFNENALYEPGYTEVVFLRVSNAGSLAFKYNLMVNIASEKTSTNVNGDVFKLSDYLQIGTYYQDEYSSGANYADILMPIMFGTRDAALSNITLNKLSEANSMVKSDAPVLAGEQTAQVMALVLTMPETVGNEANYDIAYEAPEIDLGISLVATQHTDESDSFGNQYDKDAEYLPMITTLADLRKAMAEGGEYKLGASITVTPSDMLTTIHGDGSAFVMQAGEMVLDLNGYDITVQGKNLYSDVFFITNDAKLTIKGNGNITADCGILVSSKPNSVINVEGGNFKCTVNNDMLYAIDGKLNVSGGTFETVYWNLINIYGSGRNQLVDVSGGSFEGWDPASSPDGNLLADGYKTVSKVVDGVTWYTVVAE